MRSFTASALPLKLKYHGFTLPKCVSRVGGTKCTQTQVGEHHHRGGIAVVRLGRMV